MENYPVSIGFMQGRLSPIIDGKIQAFPWDCWQKEFPEASRCGISLLEWILDQNRLNGNPIMTHDGREEIQILCQKH